MLDGWTGVENSAVRMKPYKRRKRRGEERNADMEFCPYGKDITFQDSSSVFVRDQRPQIVLAEI